MVRVRISRKIRVKSRNTFPIKSAFESESKKNGLTLEDGAKIGVMGGGPAGSLFSCFVLDMAQRIGLNLSVDIYEPRQFLRPSPSGCNMCGGIISETLVQMLAAEGIKLPPEIIQRGIDSYTLHTDTGSVRIETPLLEKRIGAVHRGCGPKDVKETKWGSFDGYLQILALEKGANLYQSKIVDVSLAHSHPHIRTNNDEEGSYDLLVVAVGVNTNSLKMFPHVKNGYRPPGTTGTMIREYYLGETEIAEYFGNSMHIFLLDISGLEFAAFIPKGDYVTFCMLGKGINEKLLAEFLAAPEVQNKVPATIHKNLISCHCNPKINIKPALKPFGDRIVFIGDCGITRLYKDGIGAAYKTAKAAAKTVVFEGISELHFKKYYWPVCRGLNRDNLIGKVMFAINRVNQQWRFARHAILHLVKQEQDANISQKFMSQVLWDMFTGSATYREIFLLTLHPLFLIRYIRAVLAALFNIRLIEGAKI